MSETEPWLEDFWAGLWPVWRRVLCGTDTDAPPAMEPILRRRRLTTDFSWVTSFEPIRALPQVTEALLWDENGMDLGPLAGRPWRTLQLAGPAANIELGQLAGTPVRHLILSNVDVTDFHALRDLVGLETLTLAHGDFGTLPKLADLTELVVYDQVSVDHSTDPGLRVRRVDDLYWPPFGPDEVDAAVSD